MADFRMPSLGADMVSGRVVEWRIAPGERVTRGAIIVEIETDKGTFDVESPADGVVGELVVAAGAKVPVGTVLATIVAGEPAAAFPTRVTSGATPSLEAPQVPGVAAKVEVPSAPQAPPPAKSAVAPMPAIPATAGVPSAPTGGARVVRASPAARRLAASSGIDLATVTGSGPEGAVTLADVERTLASGQGAERGASPVARKLAAERGIDLSRVTGTGTGGRITKADVERAIASAAPEPRREDDTVVAMRRAIAAAVARSKREIPHYYLGTDIDLSRAVAWLTAENTRRPVANRLLVSVLLLKAVAVALKRFPMLNGFWIDGAFRASEAIHVGVAVSLRGGGLIAPAIHDADQKSLDDLRVALHDVVQRARSGGLRGSEMTDPTVTVTSLGDQGVTTVFGIINPPQVAIVGLGKVTERAWADNGMLAARPVVTATLAADHRATDGHYGGLFLSEVGRLLQSPEAL